MKKLLLVLLVIPFITIACKTADMDDSSVYGIQRSCDNKYIKEALSSISDSEANDFSSLLNVACSNSTITDKLFSDNYGWEGQSNNFRTYQQKYSETTQRQTLYTKTGLAMKFPKGEGDTSYAELLYKAYTNDSFRSQHYKLPSNIKLYNIKDLTGFNEDGFSVSYTSNITNNIKVGFVKKTQTTTYNTTLVFTKINDNLLVFTERSYEKGKLTRKCISFLVKEYLDSDKLIQLEEREVYYQTDWATSVLPQVKNIMYSMDLSISSALYNAIQSVK